MNSIQYIEKYIFLFYKIRLTAAAVHGHISSFGSQRAGPLSDTRRQLSRRLPAQSRSSNELYTSQLLPLALNSTFSVVYRLLYCIVSCAVIGSRYPDTALPEIAPPLVSSLSSAFLPVRLSLSIPCYLFDSWTCFW